MGVKPIIMRDFVPERPFDLFEQARVVVYDTQDRLFEERDFIRQHQIINGTALRQRDSFVQPKEHVTWL